MRSLCWRASKRLHSAGLRQARTFQFVHQLALYILRELESLRKHAGLDVIVDAPPCEVVLVSE
jgi:hypothetical protein